MWIVIHMVRSHSQAQTVHDRLAEEGFLVKLMPVYRAVSEEENYFEIMVPEAEAAEARQVLLDQGLC